MNDKIIQAIKQLGVSDNFNENTNLIDKGILDSLKIMELIISIETIFCIEIDGEDILPENFITVNTIAMIIKKSGAKDE